MLKCVINLVISNFIRVITNIITYAATSNSNSSCFIANLFSVTSKMCESVFAAVLGYALLYQVVQVKAVQKKIPGERLIIYIVYASCALITIICTAIEYSHSCTSNWIGILWETSFLLSLLFNTCIFFYLLYFTRARSTFESSSISLSFYAVVFFFVWIFAFSNLCMYFRSTFYW